METNQVKNGDLEFLIEKDKLIKNDKILGDKKNSTDMGIYNQLWCAYAKVKVYGNSNSVNYNLKNISILCNKNGDLVEDQVDFAVNLVMVFAKNHLAQFKKTVRKNEPIVEKFTNGIVKKLFTEDEIKLLNEITGNKFVDKCIESVKPNLELTKELKEM